MKALVSPLRLTTLALLTCAAAFSFAYPQLTTATGALQWLGLQPWGGIARAVAKAKRTTPPTGPDA